MTDKNYAAIARLSEVAWEREGYKQGYRDGLAENARQDMAMARRMIANRLPLKDVKEYTGLSIAQINGLLRETKTLAK